MEKDFGYPWTRKRQELMGERGIKKHTRKRYQIQIPEDWLWKGGKSFQKEGEVGRGGKRNCGNSSGGQNAGAAYAATPRFRKYRPFSAKKLYL